MNNDNHNHPSSQVGDALPPHDLDAERAVLGCLLMGCTDFDKVVASLGTPEAFYNRVHRIVYEHLCAMRRAGEPIDLVLFQARLKTLGISEVEPDYLVQLAESFGDLERATHYAEIVAKHHRSRKLIHISQELGQRAYHQGSDPDELARQTTERLLRCTREESNVTLCLADVTPERLNWLWPNRIPIGKLTLIAGDPGLGKSFVTLDMAARLSRGSSWPDNPDEPGTCGSTIILSAEDDPADTIVPRLMAHDADLSRIHALSTVRQANAKLSPFNLSRDVPVLEKAIQQVGECKLIVIDPVSAYLGATDSHKNAEIRGLLGPLAELAVRHRVAVVAVTHLTKAYGGKALYRATGSLAFMAAARAGWMVIKDDGDPKRRLMLPVKMNLAEEPTGLAYRLVSQRLEKIDANVATVFWEPEPVIVEADEMLRRETDVNEGQKRSTRTARDECADWLTAKLANGPVPTTVMETESDQRGYSTSTLRRSKRRLGVESKKIAMKGGWHWCLPSHKLEGVQQADEDAQPKDVSAFGEGEPLRVIDPENAVSAPLQSDHPAEGAHPPGLNTFDKSLGNSDVSNPPKPTKPSNGNGHLPLQRHPAGDEFTGLVPVDMTPEGHRLALLDRAKRTDDPQTVRELRDNAAKIKKLIKKK